MRYTIKEMFSHFHALNGNGCTAHVGIVSSGYPVMWNSHQREYVRISNDDLDIIMSSTKVDADMFVMLHEHLGMECGEAFMVCLL